MEDQPNAGLNIADNPPSSVTEEALFRNFLINVTNSSGQTLSDSKLAELSKTMANLLGNLLKSHATDLDNHATDDTASTAPTTGMSTHLLSSTSRISSKDMTPSASVREHNVDNEAMEEGEASASGEMADDAGYTEVSRGNRQPDKKRMDTRSTPETFRTTSATGRQGSQQATYGNGGTEEPNMIVHLAGTRCNRTFLTFCRNKVVKCHQILKEIVGGEVEKIAPTKRSLVVHCYNVKQTSLLLNVADFGGHAVVASLPYRITGAKPPPTRRVRGSIRIPTDVGEEDIIQQTAATRARRITRRTSGGQQPTTLVELEFDPIFDRPTDVKIYGRIYRVQPYIEPALRCQRCQSYRHPTAVCRADGPTCAKCSRGHATTSCQAEERDWKCPNCERCHRAGDSRCRVLQFQKEIMAEKARSGVTLKQAYQTVNNIWNEAEADSYYNDNSQADADYYPSESDEDESHERPVPVSVAPSRGPVRRVNHDTAGQQRQHHDPASRIPTDGQRRTARKEEDDYPPLSSASTQHAAERTMMSTATTDHRPRLVSAAAATSNNNALATGQLPTTCTERPPYSAAVAATSVQRGPSSPPQHNTGPQPHTPPAFGARSIIDLEREIADLKRILEQHMKLIGALARNTAYTAYYADMLPHADYWDPQVRINADFLATWSKAPWHTPISTGQP
jgi:hypothetical protein